MNKDEMEEQHKLNGNQFNKVDKITKKEMLEKEKPINPKYVFDGKINKKIVNKNYRKPTPSKDQKKPLITLNDW
tara:strand:+ start:2566 stop:2787 length:222 start_codon:yes stop_codon:yes gene_type:complete